MTFTEMHRNPLVLQAVELAEFIRTSCPSLMFGGFMTIGSFEQSMSDSPNEEFEELFNVRKR